MYGHSWGSIAEPTENHIWLVGSVCAATLSTVFDVEACEALHVHPHIPGMVLLEFLLQLQSVGVMALDTLKSRWVKCLSKGVLKLKLKLHVNYRKNIAS